MTVEEVIEELNRWKEDLSLYYTHWLKAHGERALELEKKYQAIKKMIDEIQKILDNIETGITKEDFKC